MAALAGFGMTLAPHQLIGKESVRNPAVLIEKKPRDSARLINQTSGDTEYYTPSFIIEAAREVMGGIDLDPASSQIANLNVGATRIFTKEDNGLFQPWVAHKLWLNHPFSRAGNRDWVSKLLLEYTLCQVSSFCCITFAATSEKWFQPLMRYPQCFLSPRTNYYLPDGTLKRGVTKGSVVTCGGPTEVTDRFKQVFSKYGVVK